MSEFKQDPSKMDSRKAEHAFTEGAPAAQSRFRPVYKPQSPENQALSDAIKTKAEELEHLIDKCGSGRHNALAMTHLEIAVMFAVKQLTT
jgi:hypothetical protein